MLRLSALCGPNKQTFCEILTWPKVISPSNFLPNLFSESRETQHLKAKKHKPKFEFRTLLSTPRPPCIESAAANLSLPIKLCLQAMAMDGPLSQSCSSPKRKLLFFRRGRSAWRSKLAERLLMLRHAACSAFKKSSSYLFIYSWYCTGVVLSDNLSIMYAIWEMFF